MTTPKMSVRRGKTGKKWVVRYGEEIVGLVWPVERFAGSIRPPVWTNGSITHPSRSCLARTMVAQFHVHREG